MADQDSNQPKLRRVLQICLEIEETVAGIYHAFASRHRTHDAMYRLWAKTAREEESHARQFEMALARAGTIQHLELDEQTAKQLHERVGDAKARVAREELDYVRALQLAIDIERALADYHVATMAAFTDRASQKLFKAMMAADRGHIEALEQQLHKLESAAG